MKRLLLVIIIALAGLALLAVACLPTPTLEPDGVRGGVGVLDATNTPTTASLPFVTNNNDAVPGDWDTLYIETAGRCDVVQDDGGYKLYNVLGGPYVCAIGEGVTNAADCQQVTFRLKADGFGDVGVGTPTPNAANSAWASAMKLSREGSVPPAYSDLDDIGGLSIHYLGKLCAQVGACAMGGGLYNEDLLSDETITAGTWYTITYQIGYDETDEYVKVYVNSTPTPWIDADYNPYGEQDPPDALWFMYYWHTTSFFASADDAIWIDNVTWENVECPSVTSATQTAEAAATQTAIAALTPTATRTPTPEWTATPTATPGGATATPGPTITCDTYPANDLPVAVTNEGDNKVYFDVFDMGSVTEITFTLSMTHTNLSAVAAVLASERKDGPLWMFDEATGTVMTDTVFTDNSSTLLSAGTPPYTDSYRPLLTFASRFSGAQLFGVWSLYIDSPYPGLEGSVTDAEITICYVDTPWQDTPTPTATSNAGTPPPGWVPPGGQKIITEVLSSQGATSTPRPTRTPTPTPTP